MPKKRESSVKTSITTTFFQESLFLLSSFFIDYIYLMMKVVNIAYAMIKLQFKLPQTLKRDQSIDGHLSDMEA